ncbi:MAG: hypothetical protein ACYDFU_08895 [Nitrospirota bacterium]
MSDAKMDLILSRRDYDYFLPIGGEIHGVRDGGAECLKYIAPCI